MATILCIDDEAAALGVVTNALRSANHRPVPVHNVEAAFNVLGRGGIDLIISDYRMPGATGLELLDRLKECGYEVPVIIVTGYASVEHAVSTMKAGAIDYVTKPIRPQQLTLVVEQALELIRLKRENAQLREEMAQVRLERQILGESRPLMQILDTVRTVSPTRVAVLLQGESGTGKELLARAIHTMSERREGPFISVNCAALPENLVESTLFGHEKGAFTGALRQVKGAFERATEGTLLLDEISEMRLDLQSKLLRVLQEQEFERVGGSVPIRVDVRVVSTTNRDLQKEVERGTFREDLYYRLSAVPLRVPPLRERREDIPLLAHHFAQRTAREVGKRLDPLPPETIELLQSRDWPGNVRELAHMVERAVIFSRGRVLTPEAFDGDRFGLVDWTSKSSTGGCAPVAAADREGGAVVLESLSLAQAEEKLIEAALDATDGNRTRAARLLGISVRTLRNKLNTPKQRGAMN